MHDPKISPETRLDHWYQHQRTQARKADKEADALEAVEEHQHSFWDTEAYARLIKYNRRNARWRSFRARVNYQIDKCMMYDKYDWAVITFLIGAGLVAALLGIVTHL